ncbi:hypothetical protein ZEAMMB73_Zm00001d032960 [Zea mays]|uniref:Uncharacterized protein n=1 Tax=Zea mays TaxID=4577 RepID=A0A1D6KV42_MAIZE|nr:hypothetical protein ZEAMMB73_Zm00001d032960 [Zea mays]
MRGYEGCARRWLKLGRTRQRVWAIVGAKVGLWRCARPRRWRRGESLHHAAHVTKVRPHNLGSSNLSLFGHYALGSFNLTSQQSLRRHSTVHSCVAPTNEARASPPGNGPLIVFITKSARFHQWVFMLVSPSLAGWMTNDNPSLHHAMFGHSNIYVCS